jgi:hypothetical protein
MPGGVTFDQLGQRGELRRPACGQARRAHASLPRDGHWRAARDR